MPGRHRWTLVTPVVLCLALVGLGVSGQGGLVQDGVHRLMAEGDTGPPVAADALEGNGGRAAGRMSATTGQQDGAGRRGPEPTPGTGRRVELRALVLAVDDEDVALPTWVATLDRVGAAYDVVLAEEAPLSWETLVGPDGVGRYNAVLLTTTSLLQQGADGEWVSTLDEQEWSTLRAYERDYGVRRATLFGSYGSFPEETCLRSVEEGDVDETGIAARLTTRGAEIFDYLNPDLEVPVQDSWVYRNRIEPGCGAEPVLVSGEDVLGSLRVAPDGREQLALSFSSNEHLLQSHLLTYGLLRWAGHGIHLGTHRHFLKLDVDDFFNSSELMRADLTLDPAGIRLTGDDALNMRTQQDDLRAEHPLAHGFRLTLAYNGQGVDTETVADCTGGGEDALVAATLCVKGDVEWINHTYSHPRMNDTDLETSVQEIVRNREVSEALGLRAPDSVLKTGEYSGLGVYPPEGAASIEPPTDHGLDATNPALVEAAARTGSWYLHGNMSFESHRPECFNCSIAHPMDPRVKVVPDWPTNIAYFSATPEQQTAYYNSVFGPDGAVAAWPVEQTYEQIIDHESEAALNRIAMGSMYTNTMHIPNLHDYGGGRTLAFDWVQAVVGKYEAYYSVPLLSPSWPDLARMTDVRTSHSATKDGVRAVWDPAAGLVHVTSPAGGPVELTGVEGATRLVYGSSAIATVTVDAGDTASWPARPLS